jgi:hypothetical protein
LLWLDVIADKVDEDIVVLGGALHSLLVYKPLDLVKGRPLKKMLVWASSRSLGTRARA